MYTLKYVPTGNVRVWKHTHPPGFTVPEIDSTLLPYAEKSYDRFFFERYKQVCQDGKKTIDLMIKQGILNEEKDKEKIRNIIEEIRNSADAVAKAYAYAKTERECEQGMQGIEYKLNTVGSSRGDYPFTTFSFGLAEGELGKMIIKTILRVRKEGQGKKGFKKPVLFPKLVFLYDEEKHGTGKEYEDVFDEAIECSSKTMYPKIIGTCYRNVTSKPCELRNLRCGLNLLTGKAA